MDFQKPKLKCIHFCNKLNLHKDPKSYIEERTPPPQKKNNIPFVEHKYLGMILDQKKLNFMPHNYIKYKCNKALRLLRAVVYTNWEADNETLLKLYETLMRSKIEY